MSILVVDDHRATAESVAELVRVQTGLQVVALSDPQAAISYAEENRLTVAVLDEQMPTMRGTELWGRIRDLNPQAVAVMLTQERGADAAQRALKLNYSEHLWKSQVDQLPTKVVELHIRVCASEAKLMSSADRRLVWRKRSLFKCSPEVWLEMSTVLDNWFVSPEWRDYATVNAGESVKATTDVRSQVGIIVESESTGSVAGSIAVAAPLSGLLPKIESVLEQRQMSQSSSTFEEVASLERSYSLAAERPEVSERQVRSRSFEYSHILQRQRLSLLHVCPDCGTQSRQIALIRVPTNLIATRQVDFYDDNSRKMIDTGPRRIN